MENSNNIPTKNILNAFSISGEPVLLPGGEGTCYRVENTVLKPIKNEVEFSWLAKINNNLSSNHFRVPKSFKAKDGSFVYSEWTASEFLEGKHESKSYTKSIEVNKKFHKAIANTPKPDWFDKKADVFAISDKMAWGELPLPNFEPANNKLHILQKLLKENKLPNQLIHGDWGPDQILFHNTLKPAILDMTPYFRPADYSIADMMVSAIVNEDEKVSIIDLGKDLVDFDQLLLRALLFRTCTYIGFQIHPENNYDWTSVINKHLKVADSIIDYFSLK